MAEAVIQPFSLRWRTIGILPLLARARLTLWILPILFGLISAPSLYLAQTSDAVTLGHTTQRLKSERDLWLDRNKQLELELAKVRSLAWIENEATTRLGMQRSNSAVYVRTDRPIPPRRTSAWRPVAAPAPAAAEEPVTLEELIGQTLRLVTGTR